MGPPPLLDSLCCFCPIVLQPLSLPCKPSQCDGKQSFPAVQVPALPDKPRDKAPRTLLSASHTSTGIFGGQ